MDAGPNACQLGPDALEVTQLLQHWQQPVLAAQVEVERLLGACDLLRLLLQPNEARLEGGQCRRRDLGLEVTLDGLALVPVRGQLLDAGLDGSVFLRDAQLQRRCSGAARARRATCPWFRESAAPRPTQPATKKRHQPNIPTWLCRAASLRARISLNADHSPWSMSK